jgi:hypothetical protein
MKLKALRDGWSVRQLDRQIATAFYERTALSKDKAALLSQGARPEDAVTAQEEIKNSKPKSRKPVAGWGRRRREKVHRESPGNGGSVGEGIRRDQHGACR